MIWYPPILAYHRVHPDLSSDTPTISPDVFKRQIMILSRRWRPVPLSDLVSWLEGRGPLPPRAVVVTFDDGTEDHFEHAFPILSRYQIPATIFLIAANLGKPHSLTGDQIRQMAAGGVTFGSHTVHHAYLPSLPMEEVRRELQDSKRILEGLNLPVEFLSYPAGGFTPAIQEAVRGTGYRAACTTNRGVGRFSIDRWALRRVTMHRVSSPLELWLHCCGYYGINRRLRPPA